MKALLISLCTILSLTHLSYAANKVNAYACWNSGTERRATAPVYDGKDSIYLIGGFSESGVPGYDDIVQLNITNGKEKTVATFDRPVQRGQAEILPNGDIYFFTSSHAHSSNDIYKLSLNDPTPVLIDTKLIKRKSLFTTELVGESIFIIGGVYTSSDDPAIIEEFNTITHEIRIVADLPTELYTTGDYHGVSSVYDGTHVYIFRRGPEFLRFDPKTYALDVAGKLDKYGDYNEAPSAVMVNGDVYIRHRWSYNEYITVFKTRTQEIVELETSQVFFTGFGPTPVYVKKQNRVYGFCGAAYSGTDGCVAFCMDVPPPSIHCEELPNGRYPHPTDCSQYVVCNHGHKYEMPCPADLHFNEATGDCDYPENANCEI